MAAQPAGVRRREIPADKRKRRATPVGPQPGRSILLWPALLLAAGLAAYANSFSTPFVFDDHSSIIENPFIRQLWPPSTAMSGPIQSAVAGRPVVSLSLAINYALSGLSPSGFRVWNLAVHLLAGLVLFGVVRRTLLAPPLAPRFAESADFLAWACAIVWLVHPLNTEVVDYATQRTESMMALFYLLTIYASARAMASEPGPVPAFVPEGRFGESRRSFWRRRKAGHDVERAWRWNAVAIIACALGMATKESMVTAPVMAVVYDAVFWSGGLGRALRTHWRLYTGLAATWVILLALIVAGPRSHSAGFSSGVASLTYLWNQPAMILRYMRLAVWPSGLVLDYGVPLPLTLKDAWPYMVPVVALIAATLAAWRRHRELAFLGTWFFVTLAPASSIVPIATEVGAERRMYLPLIAIVVACVIGGWRLLTSVTLADPRRRTTIPALGLSVIAGALVTLTLHRNGEYQSPTGIWQTVLDRRPHGRAHYNLAMELKEEGNRSEAIRHYQLALTDEPAAHYAVGFELDADGKHEQAAQHYREFIRLRPDDINVVKAYVLLGRALMLQGKLEPAADAFRQALQRHSANVEAWAGLGDVSLKQERFDDAIRAYREYVRLQPDSGTAHSGLGIALVGREMEQEAVPEFARAVELEPNDPGRKYNLGNALASTGRLEDAVIQYQRALALAPTNVAIHNALAMVLAARGQRDEALAHFRESMAIDPANEQTRKDLASALPGLDPRALKK